MPRIALKIDVDTYRGTREGALRLAGLLERSGRRGHLPLQLGSRPHRARHQARLPARLPRQGEAHLGAASTTGSRRSCTGCCCRGRTSASAAPVQMRGIAAARLRGGRAHLGPRALAGRGRHAPASRGPGASSRLRVISLRRCSGTFPLVHGAAGWQMNALRAAAAAGAGVPLCLRHPRQRAIPAAARRTASGAVPQLPTTLPTLDELIGRPDLRRRRPGRAPAGAHRRGTRARPGLHAARRARGRRVPRQASSACCASGSSAASSSPILARYVAALDLARLPRAHRAARRALGTLAVQAGRSAATVDACPPQHPR